MDSDVTISSASARSLLSIHPEVTSRNLHSGHRLLPPLQLCAQPGLVVCRICVTPTWKGETLKTLRLAALINRTQSWWCCIEAVMMRNEKHTELCWVVIW